MAVLQPILDLTELLYQHGVRHVVISPGSRSAALTLSFVRHGGFDVTVAIDERSGGFIGLGIAQQTHQSVVLVCTSGSAVYNYAPAVAEAYFQQIPLIVISADRPKEWIHQYDGQTIFQNEIFGRHVKGFFDMPVDFNHKDAVWGFNRQGNEAYWLSQSAPKGPVHINVGIREPFYPLKDEIFQFNRHIRKIDIVEQESIISVSQWHSLLAQWDNFDRKLIAVGQNIDSSLNLEGLKKLSLEFEIPILADVISNITWDINVVRNHDFFLSSEMGQELAPNLLVTFGMSFISKEFKTFLRDNPPIAHWHISQDGLIIDPFKSLTKVFPVLPTYFFDNLFENIDYKLFTENEEPENNSSYLSSWNNLELKSRALKYDFLENIAELNDLTSLNFVFSNLEEPCRLQFGNSMPIRYANGLSDMLVAHWINCNRGTSGIDGCLSTAIGAAKVSEIPVFLILGDVSFLYDRNGLLQINLPSNLKIVILNNDGGNIFSIIDGSGSLPENATYFRTNHGRNAKLAAQEANISYYSVTNISELAQKYSSFSSEENCGIIEIFTQCEENTHAWKGLKAYINDNL